MFQALKVTLAGDGGDDRTENAAMSGPRTVTNMVNALFASLADAPARRRADPL